MEYFQDPKKTLSFLQTYKKTNNLTQEIFKDNNIELHHKTDHLVVLDPR